MHVCNFQYLARTRCGTLCIEFVLRPRSPIFGWTACLPERHIPSSPYPLLQIMRLCVVRLACECACVCTLGISSRCRDVFAALSRMCVLKFASVISPYAFTKSTLSNAVPALPTTPARLTASAHVYLICLTNMPHTICSLI